MERDQIQGASRHLTCKQKDIWKMDFSALVAPADKHHIKI